MVGKHSINSNGGCYLMEKEYGRNEGKRRERKGRERKGKGKVR